MDQLFSCLSCDDKNEIFESVKQFLASLNLRYTSCDSTRPWGGFYVINEDDADEFIKLFFPHLSVQQLMIGNKLSPKILIVAKNQRLSWQYHHRRAEIWKCIGGTVGVITSHTNEHNDAVVLKQGDIIQLSQGQRHRLIGLNSWGIVAEIWQHTDANNPSDEDDIIRLQDDFGR
jgi:mannose-6-phosphate isomerase